jgi:predicted transcriptional regulator
MFEKKINIAELEKLIRDGNSQGQAARLIGVSKQAVSATLKRLKAQNERSALSVSEPVVKALVGSKIDGMKQLKKINDTVIHEINFLNQKIKTVDALICVPALDVKIKVEKEKEREYLVFQRLKHIAEIRKELGLLLDISKELYNVEEVQRFQQTVLDTIGEVDENVRDKIIERFGKLRAPQSVFR